MSSSTATAGSVLSRGRAAQAWPLRAVEARMACSMAAARSGGAHGMQGSGSPKFEAMGGDLHGEHVR